MPTQIALLRAVNVAGHGLLSMAALRDMLGLLGFTECKTLLQSGNAIFQSETMSGAAVEKLLETETERRLGVRTSFMVRTPAELKKVIDENPFPNEAKNHPGHLLVIFLKDKAGPNAQKALDAAIKGEERGVIIGKHIYIDYTEGVGRSKLTAKVIEKAVGCSGTGRNWNTVQKLHALATVK